MGLTQAALAEAMGVQRKHVNQLCNNRHGFWPACSPPVFPRRIATHPFPTRHLAALVQRAVPVLRYLEKMIHPRWPTPLEATKRLVGTVVVILSTTLVFTPIPLSNVVPALVIALIFFLRLLSEDTI